MARFGNAFRHIVGAWRKIEQYLRIIEEDVDVFAVAMREHLLQHRAATNRPADRAVHGGFRPIKHSSWQAQTELASRQPCVDPRDVPLLSKPQEIIYDDRLVCLRIGEHQFRQHRDGKLSQHAFHMRDQPIRWRTGVEDRPQVVAPDRVGERHADQDRGGVEDGHIDSPGAQMAGA
jgi:hypothetical protein